MTRWTDVPVPVPVPVFGRTGTTGDRSRQPFFEWRSDPVRCAFADTGILPEIRRDLEHRDA